MTGKPHASARSVAAVVPGQPSELVRQAQEQERQTRIRELEAQAEVLRTDLNEARILAEPTHRLRKMAEEAWEAAGEVHSVAEAERLEQRRSADQVASARVTDLEHQLVETEGALAGLHEQDARIRSFARMQEIWQPTCHALVQPVRALIPALKAQRDAWELLYWEQAHGNIDRETELAIYGQGFSDELLPELERWLAAVERAGYLDIASAPA